MPSRAEQKPETLEITEEYEVQLTQLGNAEAFEQLYCRYSPRVHALCLRGNTDQAMNWLDKSYGERFNPSVLLRPGFDPLRSDPRFEVLLRRIGQPR